MDPASIPFLGLIVPALISLATIWFTRRDVKHKADRDYVATLERRLAAAETSLERCRESEQELKRDNFELMKRLYDLAKEIKE